MRRTGEANRGHRTGALGFSVIGLVCLGLAGVGPVKATILCPNQALQGGFGGTFTPVSGSQDGTCGSTSGETLALSDDGNYAKLMWNTSDDPNGPSTESLPAGLTLGNLPAVSATVTFTADQADDSPYFMLSFSDASDSLGQANATDQILLIEFQNLGINGAGQTNMSIDAGTTLFNLYDNKTGKYLQGGQSDAHSLDYWLTTYTSLQTESVNGIWLAEGLAGGGCDTCSETLTVDSAYVAASTPEPGTIGLMFAGLGVLVAGRRRIAR